MGGGGGEQAAGSGRPWAAARRAPAHRRCRRARRSSSPGVHRSPTRVLPPLPPAQLPPGPPSPGGALCSARARLPRTLPAPYGGGRPRCRPGPPHAAVGAQAVPGPARAPTPALSWPSSGAVRTTTGPPGLRTGARARRVRYVRVWPCAARLGRRPAAAQRLPLCLCPSSVVRQSRVVQPARLPLPLPQPPPLPMATSPPPPRRAATYLPRVCAPPPRRSLPAGPTAALPTTPSAPHGGPIPSRLPRAAAAPRFPCAARHPASGFAGLLFFRPPPPPSTTLLGTEQRAAAPRGTHPSAVSGACLGLFCAAQTTPTPPASSTPPCRKTAFPAPAASRGGPLWLARRVGSDGLTTSRSVRLHAAHGSGARETTAWSSLVSPPAPP